MRCVRPDFTTSANSRSLAASDSPSRTRAGATFWRTARVAAIRSALGNVSLLDCP